MFNKLKQRISRLESIQEDFKEDVIVCEECMAKIQQRPLVKATPYTNNKNMI